MVGGRLVQDSSTWSMSRLYFALLLIGGLVLTNPAISPRGHAGLLTNYGVFAMIDHGSKLTMSVASFEMYCYYSDHGISGALIEPPLCLYLRNNLAHGKPLLWDEYDAPYTIHRLFIALCVLMNVVMFLRSYQLTGNVGLDAYLVLWTTGSRNTCLIILWVILEANCVLYLVWEVLVETVEQQSQGSIFFVFEDRLLNSVLTSTVLIFAAVFINACSRFVTGHYLLQFDGILATVLGYCRAVTGNQSRSLVNLSLLSVLPIPMAPVSMSVKSVTWTLLLITFVQRSPFAAAACFGCNALGALVGEYQYQHQVSSADDIFRATKSFIVSTFWG